MNTTTSTNANTTNSATTKGHPTANPTATQHSSASARALLAPSTYCHSDGNNNNDMESTKRSFFQQQQSQTTSHDDSLILGRVCRFASIVFCLPRNPRRSTKPWNVCDALLCKLICIQAFFGTYREFHQCNEQQSNHHKHLQPPKNTLGNSGRFDISLPLGDTAIDFEAIDGSNGRDSNDETTMTTKPTTTTTRRPKRPPRTATTGSQSTTRRGGGRRE